MDQRIKSGFERIKEGENGFGEDLKIRFVLCHFMEIIQHALNRFSIRFESLMKCAKSVERYSRLESVL